MAWKWGSQSSWPEAFVSRLSALRANKKIKEAVRVAKFAKKEQKKASGIALFLDFKNVFDMEFINNYLKYIQLRTRHSKLVESFTLVISETMFTAEF